MKTTLHQNLTDSLNDAQREAVTSQKKALLVLAGAGSGKTRVLVHRIAWLATEIGLSPHAMMAVTFTNKAAAEMRHRIEALLGGPAAGMWIGTFHGLCHRLLRAHWHQAGLNENFQVLDSDDQQRLVKRAIRSLNIDEQQWPPKQAQWWINQRKDEGERPEDIKHHGDLFTATQLKIYQTYEEICRVAGTIDFAELLLRAVELFKKNPALLAHYQTRFNHILVDEFQDTNQIQYQFIRLLAGPNTDVTAVGDDDQSIYGWRGAKVENLNEFLRDYPGAEIVRLEQNYRSTGNILTAANAVIDHNSDRLGKSLWTEGDKGDPLWLYSAFNEQEEARFIAEKIEQWVDEGHDYKSCAILYRSNAQSRVLEEAMINRRIPYRIYGGLRFFERQEIKDALSYLRLTFNRDDDAAFERVVNQPPRGIGEKTVEQLRERARLHQMSLWRATQLVIQERAMPARALTALQGFMQLVIDMEAGYKEQPLHEQMHGVIHDSGLAALYAAERGEKGLARKENLEELVNAAREFEPEEEEEPLSPLAAFLTHVSLEAGESQADAHSDAVQMMTLHSAKGLEFPLVFIAGMEEGLFPHSMSLEEPGRLEEERRLCYVGITRAMKQLFMTRAEKRRLYGRESYSDWSRFVDEIPAALKREVRLGGKVVQQVYSKLSNATTAAYPYPIGRDVEHSMFGRGTVLGYEGDGSQMRVQVNFPKAGSKWLVLAYAKLEPV